MSWNLLWSIEATKDLKRLSKSVRVQVILAVQRVAENPLPRNEGGYGKPLGKNARSKTNLTGLCKVKLRQAGVCVVYKLIRTETTMEVVVVGLRSNEEVYMLAQLRRN
jgi:mRNA interferase RelE/StbE